jgi:hypothetical protein
MAPEHVKAAFVICEFNETHHVRKNMYDDHLGICPDYQDIVARRFHIPGTLISNGR